MEKIFCDLKEIAEEKELISAEYEADKWRAIQYKTKLGEGTMLIAAEEAQPNDITFDLGLSGWYRIYIGFNVLRRDNYTYLKLTGDLCYSKLRSTKRGNPTDWGLESFSEELLFRTDDLTNKKLIMGCTDSYVDSISGIMWIRCEKLTDEEKEAYIKSQNKENKCMQMHIDEDLHAEEKFNTEDDYLIDLFGMRNSNTKFCNLEYAFDYDRYEYKGKMTLARYEKRWNEGDLRFVSVKEKIYKKYVEYAHKIGIELFASERMSVANFSTPYTKETWERRFVNENPDLYCVNRDGSVASVCSYAYKEVRDYVLSNMKDVVSYGFDGVTMIFHRGMFIGFEKPVIDRFKELYPDVNPYILPMSDDRLNGVWCEFMTMFMREAREALPKNIKINVITDYGLKSAKTIGLDIEKWAEQGLIDIVTQGDMEIYEDLTGCLRDDGLIDMEKYNKEILDRAVLRRSYATNLNKVLENIPSFLSLEEKYGVEAYIVLPWTITSDDEEYADYVEKIKQAGAKRFSSWNSYTSMWNLPEWHRITNIGNEENDSERNVVKRRFIRMLSIDNRDISHMNNNWRG